MNKVTIIQGLQFGSEGKGAIAGMVGENWKPDTVACANHPNAGHTYIDPTGRKFINRVLPVSAACPSVRNILIGPGAVVDVDTLAMELMHLRSNGVLGSKQIIIHPQASVLMAIHMEAEKKLVRIGSTMKGSMEAVVHKMRREEDSRNNLARDNARLIELEGLWIENLVCSNNGEYEKAIKESDRLLLEGAQGYSLGIHERFYPYCTSRDVSTAQLMADCRIPFPTNHPVQVIGVARTYPIRVANRFNEEGEQIGTSGPCYPDQSELTWDRVGRPAELTTVTRLPRRIFTFSQKQVADAVQIMGVNRLALTFCDYLIPDWPDAAEGDGDVVICPDVVREFATALEETTRVPVSFLSFGPRFKDIRYTNDLHYLYDSAMGLT